MMFPLGFCLLNGELESIFPSKHDQSAIV